MRNISKEEYWFLKGLDDKWRWIARNNNHEGGLFAYSEKPFKNHKSGVWDYGRRFKSIDKLLFQFIQWEDEEPWNIQELIEEYEKESEEKEVKKDKEWLKEEITEILLTSKKDGTNYFYYRDLKEKIYNAIDQLNEPEVLSQELPVIPQFVADWIEAAKKSGYDLLRVIYDGAYNENVRNWMFEGKENKRYSNRNKITCAWLYGYTVEKEQQYYALIKGHELLKDKGDWVVPTYWCFDTTNGNMFISDRITVLDKYLIKASKSEWNNLGINEHNADFVSVEELE